MKGFIPGAVCVLATLFFLNGCGVVTETPDISAPNVLKPIEGITTAGQPTENDIPLLKKMGYTTIVDLRGQQENRGFSEEELVESNGLVYKTLPISGASDLTVENANKLHEILNNSSGEVFLHCGSGNRVGALLAIRAYHIDGLSAEDALALGTQAGLTSLESEVKSRLFRAAP